MLELQRSLSVYILNIHIYTLFNLEFKVAKDKLVSLSYKNDFKTTKTRNYNLLKFKILKRVILKNVALKLEKNEKQIQLELKKKTQIKFSKPLNEWFTSTFLMLSASFSSTSCCFSSGMTLRSVAF